MHKAFRSLAIALAAVLVPVALAVPVTQAHADQSIPTSMAMEDDDHPYSYGDTATLYAFVSSDVGTPTGAVTFTDEHGRLIASDVPVDTGGTARASTRIDFVGHLLVTAVFRGTNGFGDSSTTEDLECCYNAITPLPTIAQLQVGNLKVTLTMSAYLRRFGSGGRQEPAPGEVLIFQVFGTQPTLHSSGGGTEVCRAITDANGFATCKGAGITGSLASVVAGGSWVLYPFGPGYYAWAKAKVIALGAS